MDNNETYLKILADTLKKKLNCLEELMKATTAQEKLLDGQQLDIDLFNEQMTVKDKLLERLESLDNGFMELYGRVEEAIKANPGQYGSEIEAVQELIRRITDVSTSLQALEERNRLSLSVHLSRGKQKIKDFKVSNRTAAAYYKNMSGKHRDGDSYFMDKKQ